MICLSYAQLFSVAATLIAVLLAWKFQANIGLFFTRVGCDHDWEHRANHMFWPLIGDWHTREFHVCNKCNKPGINPTVRLGLTYEKESFTHLQISREKK
jgi:hypothetical protein